jgi:hypothetical protein
MKLLEDGFRVGFLDLVGNPVDNKEDCDGSSDGEVDVKA